MNTPDKSGHLLLCVCLTRRSRRKQDRLFWLILEEGLQRVEEAIDAVTRKDDLIFNSPREQP